MTFPIPPDALPLGPEALAGVAPLAAENWDVIDAYDGAPILCVLTPRRGVRLLAYRCDEDEDGAVFLLALTTPETVDELEGNRLPLRDAILTPWLAVVHAPWVSWEGDVSWGYVIRPEDVPNTHLPQPGVRLYLE